MKKKMLLALILGALTLPFIASKTLAAEKVLLDFNQAGANGTSLPGWTWYPTGANDYGAIGWRNNNGKFYSAGSNWLPRLHQNNGYGNYNLAFIDTSNYAPSSTNGGSLKVYDTGASSIYQSSWWYLWGDNFGTMGYADSTTNRLDFYFKTSGVKPLPTNSAVPTNVHIGTYLCWPGGGVDGVSCPKEASNQHYYHYLSTNDGAWLHILLDRHPTHQRGASTFAAEPIDNPALPTYGKHYFESMNAFYVEIRSPQLQPTSYWIDEIKLWTTSQLENDISISSIWVGYWPASKKWEIGFNDNSFNASGYNNTSKSSFEIRYSTLPITNENWQSASSVIPEFWRVGTTNSFRRPDSWSKAAWTRFSLPPGTEAANSTLYFAVKDVSKIANGDGHDAPSPYIKTIDYSIINRPKSTALSILHDSK